MPEHLGPMKRINRNSCPPLIAAVAASVTLAGAAETWEGDTVRFYGSTEPSSAQIRAVETDEGRVDLSILVPGPDGTLSPIFASGSCARGRLSGRSAIDGKPVEWGAELGDDPTRIIWKTPASATLRDGKTLELAGSYEETPDEQRLKRAKARFREEDDELNRAFEEVTRSLPEGLLATR